MTRPFCPGVILVSILLGVLAVAPGAEAARPSKTRLTPIIFVHGGAGSGAQFESQKMRFTSNGYPRQYVRVVEYDSLFTVNTRADVYAKIDALVAQLQRETGKRRVDILGHSLGTTIMHEYLTSSASRAANVRRYVNIDGRTATAPPGGVRTLAIWAGRGTPGRSIGGAVNVTVRNQTHVESATSREAFRAMFKFLTSRAPATVDIVPEHGRVRIAGRAVLFPSNVGVSAGNLEIWRVRDSTGQRIERHPSARLKVAADGGWGPVWLKAGKHYEFALSRTSSPTVHHFYYEPFVRSDDLVRLLTSNPGEGLDLLIEKSPRHARLVVTRNKELWGDQGAENDVLRVNGANLITPAVAPITKRLIGLFAFDVGSDGVSHLDAPLPALAALPFISGVDHYIPAADPRGTASLSLTSRGRGPTRTIRFPSFPSTDHQVSVQLNDFERICRRCSSRAHRRSSKGDKHRQRR